MNCVIYHRCPGKKISSLNRKKKVLVAISGGVDSSVAAALLVEKGYDVHAAYMRLIDAHSENLYAAQAVARHLKIKFFVFDFRAEFEDRVIKHFVKEYKKGQTPNPCVVCNEKIKFGLLFRAARTMQCSMLATGHFARILHCKDGSVLKKGFDKNEQSYFLYRLSADQLEYIMFPLGSFKKDEVRQIARQQGLAVANRIKSQDACFISSDGLIGFMKTWISDKPGKIVDKQGRVIGTHRGYWRYTYGQRRGLGISSHQPYYVLGIDAGQNTVTVGRRQDVLGKVLIADRMNYLDKSLIGKEVEVKAKIRYSSRAASALLIPLCRNRVRFIFKRPQWAITPGQSVVAYFRDQVVGGGIIRHQVTP